MKGLLLKDLLSLRRYMRTVMLLVAAYALMIFFMDSPYLLVGMIVLMSAMISVTSFSFDHMAGWDVYALSLPVSRKDVVRSKYLLALIFTSSGSLLSILIGVLYTLFTLKGSFTETLIASYALFAVGMVFVSILLPLLYKFGVEKARLLIIAVFAVPVAVIVALANIAGLEMPDEQLINRLLALSPLVLIAVLGISYFASCAIYRKKEV